MKRIYLLVFALTLTLKLFGQEDEYHDSDSTHVVEGISVFPFDVFIGKKYYQNSFYNQLNELNSPSLNAPLTFVGLGYNGAFVVNRDYSYCGHMALLYIIPQKIDVDTNHVGKISGYVFSASVAGWDLFKKNRKFDLMLSLGANVGRLRILRNEALKQKNTILAPMVAWSPSWKIKRIVVTFNFQYDYDFSKKDWRRMRFSKTDKMALNRFNQSGLSAFICVGMNID